jgi:hypothetical protein
MEFLKLESKKKEKSMNKPLYPLSILILVVGFYFADNLTAAEVTIKSFIKVGKITKGFSEGDQNYFWHIDDLCCDDENNLYVADAGWNKIFKFNQNGKFLISFGGEGYGPGEFRTAPRLGHFSVSIGNDRRIYIFDPGNGRLSVFSKNGKFKKSFASPTYYGDKVQVNKNGDIYLNSDSGEYVIDIYDKNLKFKQSFLSVDKHLRYPIVKPTFSKSSSKERLARIHENEFRKIMMQNDHLIGLSNLSLTVFHFDESNVLINEYRLENDIFLENFKERLEKISGKGGFISPFQMFKDSNESLCFLYWNTSLPNKREVYRYRIDGKLLDIIRLPEMVLSQVCTDRLGKYYFVNETNTEVGIFRIDN